MPHCCSRSCTQPRRQSTFSAYSLFTNPVTSALHLLHHTLHAFLTASLVSILLSAPQSAVPSCRRSP